MWGFGTKSGLRTRVERLEDELAALRRHLDDVEDTLTHRVGKLMARAKRQPGEGAETAPEETLAPPDLPTRAYPYPSLAAIRRKMRGF